MTAPDPASYSHDTLFSGRIRLIQRARGHRAGTDAVLLATALAPPRGERIADFGAGSGAVGLMAMHAAADCHLVMIERERELADLCRLNAIANGRAADSFVICADLLAGPVLDHAVIDRVCTNPPFFEGDEAPVSPEPGRARAHVTGEGGHALWLAAAIRALRPRGRLALIQRADKLDSCLAALVPRMGAIVVTPVLPRVEAPATRVLITAIKGARTPLRINPPLVLHGDDGRFTARAEALHRGESAHFGWAA
ncbi:MAG: tRNA1(Val) (adenine(37)-N6)-methyltransferase [Salinarimonas sp.]